MKKETFFIYKVIGKFKTLYFKQFFYLGHQLQKLNNKLNK